MVVIFTGLNLPTRIMFHGFRQAKFAYGGSILGLSQFPLLPLLPLKTMLSLKAVKVDSKISNSINLNPRHTLYTKWTLMNNEGELYILLLQLT